MDVQSFWAINPAEDGVMEPIKFMFHENGDISIVSLAEDPEYWGAYRIPCGKYVYTGSVFTVNDDNLKDVAVLVPMTEFANEFKADLLETGLVSEKEWRKYRGNPEEWRNLRTVQVKFGEE